MERERQKRRESEKKRDGESNGSSRIWGARALSRMCEQSLTFARHEIENGSPQLPFPCTKHAFHYLI